MIAAVVILARNDWLAQTSVEVGWREFDHADLARALPPQEAGAASKSGEPSLLAQSVLQMEEDRQESNKQLAGWYSWMAIAKKAEKAGPTTRDQRYRALSIRNTGRGTIASLAIEISGREQPIVSRNLASGETIVLPVDVTGTYANLSRTRNLSVTSITIEGDRWYEPQKNVRVPGRYAMRRDPKFGGLYGRPRFDSPPGPLTNATK